MQMFTAYWLAFEMVVGGMGLRLPAIEFNMEHLPIETGEATLTAFCVAGDMRTFPQVAPSLATALRNSHGKGMQQANTPDVFLNIGLEDDPNFGHLYEEQTRHHSDDDAKRLGALLKAVNVDSYTNHGAATLENVHGVEYISKESRDCFGEEAWRKASMIKPFLNNETFWRNKQHMVRSMNQLQHIKECLTSIKAYEESNNKKYTVVAIARPDMAYGAFALNNTIARIAGADTEVAFNGDKMFIFPRKLLDNFFTRSGPLDCHPGQACCGRITRSEGMFEHIFGIPLTGDQTVDAEDPSESRGFSIPHVKLQRPESQPRR